MISTVQDFEHVQNQLVRVERALAALRRDVLPVNPAQYQLMSESYVEMWQKLRAELNDYLGLGEMGRETEAETAGATTSQPES